MALRKEPIVKGEIYHIFNKTVGSEKIFVSKRLLDRAIETIKFYAFDNLDMRYSHYARLTSEDKNLFWDNTIENNTKRISIFTFSLMPNHFHFLAKEIKEKGISSFIGNFQNSIAKFYNTRNKRPGAIFQSGFKAVRIENDEQFVHVARYIHLNPLTSFLIKNPEDLKIYPGTSFPDYLGTRDLKIINKEFLLNFFPSIEKMVEFTFNQVDYQRKLAKIKALAIE
jgi:putative transposase